MSRALVIVSNERERAQAAVWVAKAPLGTRVEFKAPKRTVEQNSRMWVLLTKIAHQLSWHGMKLSADDWKLIFLDALKTEMRLVPNIAGNGFVNLGRSSSDLSKEEFGDLMTVIEMFGAAHSVDFGDDPATPSPAAREPDAPNKRVGVAA